MKDTKNQTVLGKAGEAAEDCVAGFEELAQALLSLARDSNIPLKGPIRVPLRVPLRDL